MQIRKLLFDVHRDSRIRFFQHFRHFFTEILTGHKTLYRYIINLFFLPAKRNTFYFSFVRNDRKAHECCPCCLCKHVFRLTKIFHCVKILFYLLIRCITLKSSQQILKLQLFEQGKGFRRVQIGKSRILQHKINWAVGIDRRQFFAEDCQIIVLQKSIFRLGRLDLLHMGTGILDRAIRHDQFGRRLFTDSRKSRNIVRGITHHRLQFNDLRRCHLILLQHFFCMVILDLRAGPLRLWYADHDVLCCKLQKIPVTGDHRNIQTFLFHPLCHRSKQVIRLIAFFHQKRYTHRRQHFFHDRHLLVELRRLRLSRPFVSIIHFMAKGRCFQVKSNRQILRLFFRKDFK